MSRRILALVPAVALTALVLAGCTADVDPDAASARAAATFAALVDSAAQTDGETLRTLTTAEPVTQECSRPAGTTQQVLTATGVLSVQAAAAQSGADELRDTLGATLDTETWRPMADAVDAPDQKAWIAEDGVLVTLTSTGPAIVIAAFTPCLED